jgi:hypothetical protein
MTTSLDKACATPGRRKFITFLGASASTLALQACGGGGAVASPTTTSPISGGTPTPDPTNPPPSPAPVWTTVPTLVFTQGVPSSISVAAYVSLAGTTALQLSLNSVTLPSGVTFNAANRSFDYDGQGGVVTTSGHVLTAAG